MAPSSFAHAGGRSAEAALRAFECAARELAVPELRFLPAKASGLAPIDNTLSVLVELAPQPKGWLLHAAALTVAADREVAAMEVELLRAIADSLGCPMPPLLPGQPLV